MILLYTAITIITFLLMEGVAWATHKFVMHGLLWSWHRDHHQVEPGFFEKNDLFFLVFAIPSFGLFLTAALTPYIIFAFFGLGILLYGICYFLVHDIFIHQRFKLFRNAENWYFKAIRRAHKIHHKNRFKEKGECFGMLFVPFRYLKQAKKSIL